MRRLLKGPHCKRNLLGGGYFTTVLGNLGRLLEGFLGDTCSFIVLCLDFDGYYRSKKSRKLSVVHQDGCFEGLSTYNAQKGTGLGGGLWESTPHIRKRLLVCVAQKSEIAPFL